LCCALRVARRLFTIALFRLKIACNTRKFHHNKILLETRFSFIF
jgi:hypothetical protein